MVADGRMPSMVLAYDHFNTPEYAAYITILVFLSNPCPTALSYHQFPLHQLQPFHYSLSYAQVAIFDTLQAQLPSCREFYGITEKIPFYASRICFFGSNICYCRYYNRFLSCWQQNILPFPCLILPRNMTSFASCQLQNLLYRITRRMVSHP